ncbi:MAG: hypothetical protein IJE25_00730 [Clostridia bacterium]|nr:hypothetical protein [Clostridia bacterium]
MVKRILCVFLLMLTLICVLASCTLNGGTTTHTHSYAEWETTKKPTCTAEGTKERYCSCGEKQTATIAVAEHEYGEWETVKEATFSETGEEIRRCACGAEESRSVSKKAEVSTIITQTECYNELSALYNATRSQPQITCTTELNGDPTAGNGTIKVTLYYDGTHTIMRQYADTTGIGIQDVIYGILDGKYTIFMYSENGDNISRLYGIMDERHYRSELEYMYAMSFQELEHFLEDLEDASHVECKKVIGDFVKYTVTVSHSDSEDVFTIETKDGYITRFEWDDNYYVYTTDEIVTFPDISDYELYQ